MTKKWNPHRIPLVLLGLAISFAMLTAGGCQQTPRQVRNAVNLYYGGNYPAAEDTLKPLAQEKDENFVLNNCRLGSAALAAGDLATAQNAFEDAAGVIESGKAGRGPRAVAAAVVFEGIKVWKGEPFERAMAFYYLGLINLIQGNYADAKDAFSSSIFKLREYASKDDKTPDPDKYTPYESNFALGYYGLGLCDLRLGNPTEAKAAFDRVVQLQPYLAPLVQAAYDPHNNVWIFVDYGQGPTRSPKGWYNEESAFGPTPAEVGPLQPIQTWADGQLVGQDGRPALDTLAMAQDQKWQDIDTIRKTKAVIGTGAMAAGAGVAAYGASRGNVDTALVGLGIAGLGAAMAASSQADLRYWEMLPRTVYIVPAALTPGAHTLQVAISGATIPPFQVNIKPQGDNFFYIRLPMRYQRVIPAQPVQVVQPAPVGPYPPPPPPGY